MEKIVALLHEGTIIDFKVLGQVILRYKLHLCIAIVFFCSFFTYHYYTQPMIYSVSSPIKVVTNLKVATDLSALLPVDNTNILTLEELNITLSSLIFLKSFAALAVDHPAFLQLDFGSTRSRKSNLGSDFYRICSSDRSCMIDKLGPNLKELFLIEQGLTENRFNLITNAIDKKTVQVLAKILGKAIETDRVRVRQYSVQKEIKSVISLIEESRSVMQKMGGYTALEDQEKLNNNILDLKDRIRMLQGNTSTEIANATALQAKLSQNRKTTKDTNISSEGYESYLKAQARLNEIRMNITNFSHIPEEKRTPSDKLIISQLSQERIRLLGIMPAEQELKTMVLDESFKNKQRENSGNYEFEYLVSKNKIAKLKEDYESSKNELNKMTQEKLVNENKVNGMKSDLDFLKNLESKLMSLKLLNATMNSDLIFEDSDHKIEEFRKSSHAKILLFSLAITAFLYLISILVRFSIDDKIYGEEEIRMYFKELEFIGEVPSFE